MTIRVDPLAMPTIEEVISDDEDATAPTIPVHFMRCSGECLEEKAASTSRDVLARAAHLVTSAVGRQLPFELLSLTTWSQLDPAEADTPIAAVDSFAVLLRGQHFDVSPLCIGDAYVMQYGEQRSAANIEWSLEGVARRMGTRNDLYQLANRISLGGSLAPPRPPREDPEDTDMALAEAIFARISGLVGRPELNGMVAKMLKYDKTKSRWGVALVSSGERILLKPVNLEPCADPRKEEAAKDDMASYAGDEEPPDIPSDDELSEFDDQADLDAAAADNTDLGLASDMASCYVHS